MKKAASKVRIGGREYRKIGSVAEHVPGFAIVDKWDVFSSDADHYVLGAKITDHKTFLEVYCNNDAMLIARAWRRRPRDDGEYWLIGKGTKYYGIRLPTAFAQKLKAIGYQSA